MLYHEATFTHDLLERAVTTFHTTALEAGQFASACEVGLLIIGHYSSRYKELSPLLDEAKTQFDTVALAIEGEDYVLEE